MGTTLLAAYFSSEGVHWLSVGDSLLLLVRDGQAHWLNEDHSMVPVIERQVQSGLISREQADRHPERNDLLSVLSGLYTPDMIDCRSAPYPLKLNDTVILASDGIQTLSLSQIATITAATVTAEECAELLLDTILDRNNPLQDNAAVQVIRVG